MTLFSTFFPPCALVAPSSFMLTAVKTFFLLQQTAELQFILEAGTGQEVWRSPASGAH